MQQRTVVQLQLQLSQRQRRAVGCFGMADTNIFGDKPAHKIQMQPGKFRFDSVRAQIFDQSRFQKIRQADAVESDDKAQADQHQQKHADAAPTETDAAFAPKTGSHITECSPEW